MRKVDPPPMAKRPLHLDLSSENRAGEVERLVGLGASVEEELEAHSWMRDPEGNDFCVVDG